VYLNNGLTGGLGMGGWFPLLIAVMALAIRTTARQGDDLRTAFTLAFLGFFAAAALQQKGFSYHYLTAMGFGVLLLARAWQTRPPTISWYPSGILVRLGFLLLLMILFQKTSAALQDLSEPHHRRYRPDPEYGELLRTTKQLAEGKPIMVLSTNPVHGWPLTLSADVMWASRYMHLWPMAAFYHEQLWRFPPRMVQPRPLEERSAAERRFHDEVIEDLERGSPRLLLVVTPDSSQWGLGGARRFDYLEYFGVDPRFQSFMKDYQELPRLGSYRLWLRTSQ
jgi:hypothetical protein